jgi:Arc/MetJ family transcription regulator
VAGTDGRATDKGVGKAGGACLARSSTEQPVRSDGYPPDASLDILGLVKTSIDIDRGLADEVAEILGTATLKDTVHLALVEVRRAEMRRRLAERVRSGTLPVPTREELRRMRAPRLPAGALSGDPGGDASSGTAP